MADMPDIGRRLPPGKAWVALGFLIIVGAGMRWYGLTEWSLWGDEGHTYDRCLGIDPEQMADKYPLNFMILRAFMGWLGPTELGGRLFPFMMGVLSLPVVFLFTDRMFDRATALLTVAIVAFSDWHLDWSQNARHYALLFVLMTCSAGWFYLGLERNRLRLMILSLVALILAILTHPSGAFLVPAYVIYPFAFRLIRKEYPRGWNWRNVLVYLVPLGLGFLAVLPKFVNLVNFLLFGKYPWNPWWNVMGSVGFYLGFPLLVFSVCGHWVLIRRKDPRAVFTLSLIIGGACSLLAVSILTVASGAYNLYLLWPIAMPVGWLTIELTRALPGNLRFAAFAVPFVIVLTYFESDLEHFTVRHGNRPRWRQAFEYVQRNMDSGDEVYASSGSVGNFYFRYKRKVGWLGEVHPDRLIGERQPAWIMVLSSTGGFIPVNQELREFLNERCVPVRSYYSSTSFKERIITVYRWEPQPVPDEEGAAP